MEKISRSQSSKIEFIANFKKVVFRRSNVDLIIIQNVYNFRLVTDTELKKKKAC